MNKCLLCDLDSGAGHYHLDDGDTVPLCASCYHSDLMEEWLDDEDSEFDYPLCANGSRTTLDPPAFWGIIGH